MVCDGPKSYLSKLYHTKEQDSGFSRSMPFSSLSLRPGRNPRTPKSSGSPLPGTPPPTFCQWRADVIRARLAHEIVCTEQNLEVESSNPKFPTHEFSSSQLRSHLGKYRQKTQQLSRKEHYLIAEVVCAVRNHGARSTNRKLSVQ
jgi:hypothetical protein